MRILTTLPQDDLNDVPAAARAAEAAGYDGLVTSFGGVADTVALSGGYGTHQDIPPDLVQDIRRLPSVFAGYRRDW